MIKKILTLCIIISVCNNNVLPAPTVGEHPLDQFFYALDLRDLVYQENLHDRYYDSGTSNLTEEQISAVRTVLQTLDYEQWEMIKIYPLKPDVQAFIVPTQHALYINVPWLKANNGQLNMQLAYAVIYLQKCLYAPDRLYQALASVYWAAEGVSSITMPFFGRKISYGLSDVTQSVHSTLGTACNACGWQALKHSEIGQAVTANVPGLWVAHGLWNLFTYQKCYLEVAKITYGLYAKTKNYFWTQVIKNPAEKLLQEKGLIVG